MATLNTPAGSRPNAQGMSQGTYTGDVNFSRGTTDLIASGAHLPSSPTAKNPSTSAPASSSAPNAGPVVYGATGHELKNATAVLDRNLAAGGTKANTSSRFMNFTGGNLSFVGEDANRTGGKTYFQHVGSGT